MSYEDSPQAALGVTCIRCGRALAAADSLALHMGPICRKKTGSPELELSPEAMRTANRLTGLIARDGASVDLLSKLKALSPALECLADELALLRSAVTIINDGAKLRIEFRYSQRAVDGFKIVPGRRFHKKDEDGNAAHWTTPLDSKPAVLAWLCRYFGGELLAARKPGGPMTLSTIPKGGK